MPLALCDPQKMKVPECLPSHWEFKKFPFVKWSYIDMDKTADGIDIETVFKHTLTVNSQIYYLLTVDYLSWRRLDCFAFTCIHRDRCGMKGCLGQITRTVDDYLKLAAEFRMTFLSNWLGNSLTTAILAKGLEREKFWKRHNASAVCDGLTVNTCMEHWKGPSKQENMKISASALRFRSPAWRTRPIFCLKTIPDFPPFLFLQYLRLSELTALQCVKLRGGSEPTTQLQTMPRNWLREQQGREAMQKTCEKPGGAVEGHPGPLEAITKNRNRPAL